MVRPERRRPRTRQHPTLPPADQRLYLFWKYGGYATPGDKGDDIRAAAAQLMIALPSLGLVIAGVADRRRRVRLVRRARSLGIGDRVRVLGVLSARELTALRATATLAAVPALAGAASVPALAALAAGIPLLASDATDLDEIAGPALRLPTGRPEEWGDALTALIDDPTRRRAMAAAGRAHAAGVSWTQTTGVVRAAWAEATGG